MNNYFLNHEQSKSMQFFNILLASLYDFKTIGATGIILFASIQEHPTVSILLSVGVFCFAVYSRYQSARKKKLESDTLLVELKIKKQELLEKELQNQKLKDEVDKANTPNPGTAPS